MINCEQVKELLSPYLDNVLAEEERHSVSSHIEICPDCNARLADFRRFDILLSQLPRISPGANLHERIFSSPEYLELAGTSGARGRRSKPTAPYRSVRKDTTDQGQYPQLAALPGGRNSSNQRSTSSLAGTPRDFFAEPARTGARKPTQKRWGQRILQTALVASVLLVLSVGGLIGWNLWQRQAAGLATNTGTITPPAGLQQGPLPAGIRFLFLRDGALWSAPSDGHTGSVRLTPVHTTVAANWAVRPAQTGRNAGNLVAYIDLQQGLVHLIRSDGQNDIVIQQPLLKKGVQPSTVWNTATGATILNSLAWSNDGSKLAFVADPTGSTLPGLHIYTVSTNNLQTVALPAAGAVSHVIWSPDSIRIAFELTLNGNSTILDYNTQSRGVLTLQTSANAFAPETDTVLSLQWSPNINAPALTWSLGQPGQVHTIWIQRVGIGGAANPTLLKSGTFTQAVYSPAGHKGIGSWLLVANNAGVAGDITSVDLATFVANLTTGKQVYLAQWSPDGNTVDYFEALSNGMGLFHVLNTLTGTDTLLAAKAVAEPLPAWSIDSQRVAYSTGASIVIVNVRTPATPQTLKQQGKASVFSWSNSVSSQLILATANGPQGLYLVDTQRGTSLQLDKQALQGPILWTQIP